MGVTIQIRHVPEDVYLTLKSRAALEGLSMSDYLLREISAIAKRPSAAGLRARLADRSRVETSESMEEAVRAERDAR